MRVLQIIPDFGTGGAEKVVLTYMREFLKKAEFDVRTLVLSSNKHRLYEECVINEKLKFTFLEQELNDSRLIMRAKQIRQIRDFVREFNPDVIHIHLSILWVVCLATAGLKIKRKFHTLHSDPRKTSYGKNVFIDTLCYKLFGVTPICLNETMKKHSDQLFHRTDTLVLENGICIQDYAKASGESIRKELMISESALVLGHIGRFVPVKNHDKIFSVFMKLLEKHPDSALILVGEGDNQEIYKKKCRQNGIIDKVFFLGTRADIPNVLKAMDVFIFPSHYEGLGIVLIEAQAASDYCVISESIPKEAIVSPNVCRISNNASDEVWADAIIDQNEKCLDFKDITAYDIGTVMNKLINIYKGETQT